MAGQWIRSKNEMLEKITGLFIAGALLTVVGLAWSLIYPINKSLWSSSYVVYTAGIASTATALCIWLIDYKGYKKSYKTIYNIWFKCIDSLLTIRVGK